MTTLILFFFILGCCVGSYLNVLIYRLPLDGDTVFKRSHCPQCQKQINWYENLPLVSFMFLRGKCSQCKGKISLRYPFVELLMGLVAVLLMPHSLDPMSAYFFFMYFSMSACFVAHIFIDLKHKLLPDKINIYLGVLLLSHGLVFLPWTTWVIGGAVGFGLPYFVTWLFYRLTGKIGLGGGDIKLFAVLGLYLGAQGVIMNIFLSCFFGAVITLVMIALKVIKRDEAIPFGPFIIIAASFQIYLPGQYKNLLVVLGLS